MRFPNERIYVAVLSNGSPMDPGLVAGRLASVALGKPLPGGKAMTLGPKQLEQYVGEYRARDNFKITMKLVNGQLHARSGKSREMTLVPHAQHAFFVSKALTHFQFKTDSSGKIMALIVIDPSDAPKKAVRVGKK